MSFCPIATHNVFSFFSISLASCISCIFSMIIAMLLLGVSSLFLQKTHKYKLQKEINFSWCLKFCLFIIIRKQVFLYILLNFSSILNFFSIHEYKINRIIKSNQKYCCDFLLKFLFSSNLFEFTSVIEHSSTVYTLNVELLLQSYSLSGNVFPFIRLLR